MTKLLIIIPAFKHGGTNKSLQNMLGFLSDKYEISIFSLSHIGHYKRIFRNFEILSAHPALSLIYDDFGKLDFRNESFLESFSKLCKKTYRKVFKIMLGKNGLDVIQKKAIKRINENKFDVIIAMQEGYTTQFVSKFKTNKIAWVRSDYSEYQKVIGRDEGDIYKEYNSVICVSEYTKNIFLEYYPFLKERCFGIHNMIDYEAIINFSRSNDNIDERFSSDEFTILSIGRLSQVKRFDLIPIVAKELNDDGFIFRWYIIGGGEEYNNLTKIIKDNKIGSRVILLGQKNNPYPYIKSSNLVVVTSYSEACPNVLNEAKILQVPILSTDYGSAYEFISNSFDGVIVSKEDLKHEIANLIINEDRYNRIKNNLKDFKYTNEQIINNITSIIDDLSKM
ncbi:MAG: hypothetical protein A2Y20_01260 [Firmicutes bacterium GWF2_51_9]|nr:MAG: hypothetical protein A2Y20_01260 [Firmicutes bacterium GWF2_51_9]OGS58362.1 MAG: hypothetical protein A2Y19_08615 [Firmicutes bacterium GWE2_51_13]HAM64159.1 hypothetical protein [Erysipelotrichaceae bacterium]HBZ40782.1 hypothetical protein [Erysipelotrichaceae bacterium]